MEKHIDVLSYLMTAIVFSAGFVTTRAHSAYQAMQSEVRAQSWRVRSALQQGAPIGPADLAETIAVLRRSDDRVLDLSRLINAGLFLASGVIFWSGLTLLERKAPSPHNSLLMILVVFLGVASVVVISELDLRKVARGRRAMATESLAGWFSELADALAGGRMNQFLARLDGLAQIFPDWTLLGELRAYNDLEAGRPEIGLRRIEGVIRSGGHLYLTPVIGTACAIAAGDRPAALRLLERLADRRETGRERASMHQGLAIAWAHLDALTDGPVAGVTPAPATAPPSNWKRARARTGIRAKAQAAGRADMPRDPARALDIRASDLPQTAALLDIANRWHRSGDLASLLASASGQPIEFALRLAFTPGEVSPDAVRGRLRLHDSASLETLGIICLAQGRRRDALRFLERSIRIMPGNHRTHWAMALVCQRLGWHTAADSSLQKMDTLLGQTPLLRVTRMAFSAPDRLPQPGQLREYFAEGIDTLTRLQLALLGIEPPGPVDGGGVKNLFLNRLIADALRTARPSDHSEEALH